MCPEYYSEIKPFYYDDVNKTLRYQKNRIQNNIVIVTDDREDLDVALANFDNRIDVLRIPNMKLRNVFSSIKLHSKFGKGTIFVFSGGTHDLLCFGDLPDCLEHRCSFPQQILTLPLFNDDNLYLVKKALNLNADLLYNTEHDIAIFCGLMPLPFDQYYSYVVNNRQCYLHHSAKIMSYGGERNFKNYKFAVKAYNDFTKYHAKVLSYDPWDLEQSYFSRPRTNVFALNYYNINADESMKRTKLVKTLCSKLLSTSSLNSQLNSDEYYSTYNLKHEEMNRNIVPLMNCLKRPIQLVDANSPRQRSYVSSSCTDLRIFRNEGHSSGTRRNRIDRSFSSQHSSSIDQSFSSRHSSPIDKFFSSRHSSPIGRSFSSRHSSPIDRSSSSRFSPIDHPSSSQLSFSVRSSSSRLCQKDHPSNSQLSFNDRSFSSQHNIPNDRSVTFRHNPIDHPSSSRHSQIDKLSSFQNNSIDRSFSSQLENQSSGSQNICSNDQFRNFASLPVLKEERTKCQQSDVELSNNKKKSLDGFTSQLHLISSIISEELKNINGEHPLNSLPLQTNEVNRDIQAGLRKRLGEDNFKEYCVKLEVMRSSFNKKFEVYRHLPQKYTYYKQYYHIFSETYNLQFSSGNEEHKNDLWNLFWKSNYNAIKNEEWQNELQNLLANYFDKTAIKSSTSSVSSFNSSSTKSINNL